jgi:hypothetical protein
MKEIISLIYESSDKSRAFCENKVSLTFFLGHFIIGIGIGDVAKDEHNDEISFPHIENINDFFQWHTRIEITQLKISLCEYLGHREDGLEKDLASNSYKVAYQPSSFAKTIFKTMREINRKIPTLEFEFFFKTHYGDSALYCNTEPDYLAYILISPNSLNINNSRLLIEILQSVKLEQLHQLFWEDFFEKGKTKNVFEPQFVNTNTKVRRLGYLVIFTKLISERKKLPLTFTNKKFEDYAIKYSHFLTESEYSKGLIQKSNGKSAEPYIDLLREFNLIETINKVVVPSKKLKVYLELSTQLKDADSANPFILNELDKLFFLELILNDDYLYFSVLLEMIYVKEKTQVNSLINSFQSVILKRLDDLLSQTSDEFETKTFNRIKHIKKRIEEWKKPQVYLEHIIMPRINWMADLDIIKLSSDNYVSITEAGNTLTEQLLSWIDISAEFVESSRDYSKRFYPHVASLAYRRTMGTYPEMENIYERIDGYLRESFLLFKTLAPNRVTSSQAFTFIKYSFYNNEKICVSEQFLARVLQEELNNKYIYKYQQRYGDGYIQMIKNQADVIR